MKAVFLSVLFAVCLTIALADEVCGYEQALVGEKTIGDIALNERGFEFDAQFEHEDGSSYCYIEAYVDPMRSGEPMNYECLKFKNLRLGDPSATQLPKIDPDYLPLVFDRTEDMVALEDRHTGQRFWINLIDEYGFYIDRFDLFKNWTNFTTFDARVRGEGAHEASLRDDIDGQPIAPASLYEGAQQRQLIDRIASHLRFPDLMPQYLEVGQVYYSGNYDPYLRYDFLFTIRYTAINFGTGTDGTLWVQAEERLEFQPTSIPEDLLEDPTTQFGEDPWLSDLIRVVSFPVRAPDGTILFLPSKGPYCS